MNLTSHSEDIPALQIAYDGECPFCTTYVRLLRLRDSVGQVELVDARSDHPVLEKIRAAGLDINEGFVALYQGQMYWGDDCLHFLSLMSTPSGVINQLMAAIFRRKRLSKILYPVLRFGRNTTLRILGRKKIDWSMPDSA